MDVHTNDEVNAPNGDNVIADIVSSNFDSLQSIASNDDTILFSKSLSEILTKVELDLAFFSEKLVNLNVLVLHVAMRETDFEAFAAERDHDLGDVALKALEFDLLSVVLDSEVRELDSFVPDVQSELNNIRELVNTYELSSQSLDGIEDKIHDSEESMKQLIDQVSEIKAQSAKFQRIISRSTGEGKEKGRHGADIEENGDFFDLNEKVKMQTAEQQRHFLRMLEKSLERELDLEKKVSELKQIDEETKLKLQSSKQEAFLMEEEALFIWQKLFEAENASEVLMGISKEMLSRLYSEIENNTKLNEELTILRVSQSEKVDLLERQLKETETKLQNSLASADASKEKQGLLYDTINDMQIIIENLKSRVSRGEIRAEGVEENCIKLSEINSELNEEINFLRNKIKCLEGSLQKSEENKIATAKDIGIRTKVITDLVMQLAFERERLQLQICSLKKENKLLSHETGKDPLGPEGKNERSDVATTSFEIEKIANNNLGSKEETKLEAVRNIDPRQINYKYAVMTVLALAFSLLAGVLVNQKQGSIAPLQVTYLSTGNIIYGNMTKTM